MVNGGKPDEDVIIVFWIDSHHLESLYWFELFLFIYSVMFDFSFEAATDPYMRFIHLKGASISPHLHLKNFTFERIFARNLANNTKNRHF